MNAAPFERLHPAVQHHIVNSLGWPSLRPTQMDAISPILENRHCILLAPTAGGKTEAAIFPILSRMLSEGWRDLSVLYVCPIRALLNNLAPRLSYYFSLVGRSVGVWHGDVSQSAKQRLLKSPPDLLLTTPESLEGMLISTDERRRSLLMGVRSIVIDELHAFCGDDRGWHVRCLIRRLSRLADRPIQTIGLTATVANPASLIHWLSYGAPAEVIGESGSGTEADVSLDYVGSLENAATVISRLHAGEKRLVFCDSRSKVEELSALLRNLGVRTFVSHSSLSADERRQAEKAFAEESGCVIVATSTLELGIDVGDLDRVIQIDAPATVASFLQRMGRTGRRSGSLRNCLFLATEDEGFLVAAAVLRLWREGYVEAITPPPQPLPIVAQQALALTLHHSGLAYAELLALLVDIFPEIASASIKQIIDFMIETGILWDDEGIVSMGVKGEEDFGRRHFETVVSTFDAPLTMTVLYGQKELGNVDPMSLRQRNEGPSILILAGRYWRVVSQDWDAKIVRVEPSEDKGKAAWFGSSKSLGFDLCRMIQSILLDRSIPATLTKRSRLKLDELADSFEFLKADKTVAVCEASAEWRWWTFAGWNANWVLADMCRQTGNKVASFDNYSIKLKRPPEAFQTDILQLASQIDGDTEKRLMALAEKFKYSLCLPLAAQLQVLFCRLRNVQAARIISEISIVQV
jgi:ATP-dependent Lhr-like helicase